MSSRRPLRIACLHGYRQNAQRFRHKTGGLRKSLERNINLIRPSSHSNSVSQTPSSDRLALAELVYIDAPFVVEKVLHQDPATDTPPRERVVFSPNIIVSNASRDPNDPTRNKNVKDLTQRTWWEIEGRIYAGWDQSKEYLRAQFAEKQFDGILGFSQGAIITSLICALQSDSTSRMQEFSSLRFAIMLSGFPSRADDHQHFYANPINIPSMHIWGLKDEVIPPFASKMLMDKFQADDRRSLEHANGHIVPSDAHSRNAICDFALQFAKDTEDDVVDPPRAAL